MAILLGGYGQQFEALIGARYESLHNVHRPYLTPKLKAPGVRFISEGWNELSPVKLEGFDAVIDKDRASALLARQLEADLLVLATDVDGVYSGWGTDEEARISEATVDELRTLGLASGSMGPKVEAACDFVEATGGLAVIGALRELEALVTGAAGTRVVP